MDTCIRDDLCRGLRACGIPKEKAYHILNIIEKWDSQSGSKWTVGRIKDLRQWYETYLAGNPIPPKWWKKGRDQLPTGIWKWVFHLPIPKALGVLSASTVYYAKGLEDDSKEKFLRGLAGTGTQDLSSVKEEISRIERFKSFRTLDKKVHLPKRIKSIPLPTVFDMTGSVPVHDGRFLVRPEGKLGKALQALDLSWKSIPQVTFDFLDDQDLLGFMPKAIALYNPNDIESGFSLGTGKSVVGRIGLVQEPERKTRVVANPNRIVQATLEPLKSLFMSIAHELPSDVTFDQDAGVRWAQNQLQQGHTLAGSDLTSASDLLDLDCCLYAVETVFNLKKVEGYLEFRDYFKEISRLPWFSPQLNQEVRWEVGNPLGTGPSFGLLTLANNCLGYLAYQDARNSWRGDRLGDDPFNCFRVVGDDIVMRVQLSSYYEKWIERFGGEVNSSKTLKSNKVAEFAGRIITPQQAYLKKVKFSEPSDDSFMSYVSQLGDQAKHFLRPKQRKVYDFFKEVPGFVVDGPWLQDSYGVPLSERYQWYLEEVQPALSREEPDLKLEPYDLTLLKAQLSVEESGELVDLDSVVPIQDELYSDYLEGYLPSMVTPSFKAGGDPRRKNHLSLLDALNKHIKSGDIKPFKDWKAQLVASRGSLHRDPVAEEPISGNHRNSDSSRSTR